MQQTYRLAWRSCRREMEPLGVLCQAAADAAARGHPGAAQTAIHSGVPVGKWLELQRQVQARRRQAALFQLSRSPNWKNWASHGTTGWKAAWKGFASSAQIPHGHDDLLVLGALPR